MHEWRRAFFFQAIFAANATNGSLSLEPLNGQTFPAVFLCSNSHALRLSFIGTSRRRWSDFVFSIERTSMNDSPATSEISISLQSSRPISDVAGESFIEVR